MLYLSHNNLFGVTWKPDQRYFVWVDIHQRSHFTWARRGHDRYDHRFAQDNVARPDDRRTPPTLLSSLRHSRLLGRHLGLESPHRKTSGGVKSGELAGHWTRLEPWHYALSVVHPRPISFFLAVWVGVPSCWNRWHLSNKGDWLGCKNYLRSLRWSASLTHCVKVTDFASKQNCRTFVFFFCPHTMVSWLQLQKLGNI